MGGSIQPDTPSFDIIMASFHRPDLLDKALSKITSVQPVNLNQVRLILLETDKETLSVAGKFVDQLSLSTELVAEKPGPGASRNALVAKSQAQWLCFLDDDTIVSDQYFSMANDILQNHSVDCFGGPDQPLVTDIYQRTLGEVLGTRFLMGPTFRRHSRNSLHLSHTNELSLTLCNLWIKKNTLEKFKLRFPEDLGRCEENLLLDSLKKNNAALAYFPDLYVYHLRRTHILQMAVIQLKSGFYRGLVMHHQNSRFKLIFLIPLSVGMGIVILPLLNPWLFLKLVIIHSILNLMNSLKVAIRTVQLVSIPLSFVYTIIIHTAFSLGIMAGTIRGLLYVKK